MRHGSLVGPDGDGIIRADSFLPARQALKTWEEEEAKGSKVTCQDRNNRPIAKEELRSSP
jgi:hypothetical protein